MPISKKQSTIFTQQVVISPGLLADFIKWQAKLNSAIAESQGFVSLEFLVSQENPSQWTIVQRFSNPENLVLWQQSKNSNNLNDELTNFISKNGIKEKIEKETNLAGNVTEVIITDVDPRFEKAYREWCSKIHQVEANFEGFRGAHFQSPHESHGRHWVTLVQFDTPEHLDLWLESRERKELLKETSSFISSFETHRMASPYAGWFSSLVQDQKLLPPLWKQTMMVLLVLFPIVMLQLKFLSPLTISWNHALGTFFANAISVSLISFPMMPLAIKFLGWWLKTNENYSFQKTIVGTAIVLLLYLIEIIIFWNFL